MVVSIAKKKLKDYPLVICYIAIEHCPFIVDLPIKDGDFPVRFLHVYQKVNYPFKLGDGTPTPEEVLGPIKERFTMIIASWIWLDKL